MVRVESERSIPPEQRYAAIIFKLERRRQDILNPPQVSAPLPLWRRLFGSKTQQEIPREEQLAQLETDFKRQIFSDRRLVVCHLKANPHKQEEIIADYLQSPELLKDVDTLGQFFAFWFGEFCQKENTGPIENLLSFIKTSASRPLPPELHQARREIFEPVLNLLKGEEKEIFKNIKEAGIFGVSQQLAKALMETNRSLPNGFKKEYQKYVEQVVKIEAGITPVGPAEPEPKKPKNKAKGNKKPPSPGQPKTKEENSPRLENPPSVEVPAYSFWIVSGPNKDPIEIKNLEELTEAMKKIKGLGPVTAADVWNTLQKIISTPPLQRMERYGERVAGGTFKGWWKANLGGKYRLIFWTENNRLYFRVGSEETVYATRRRKPRDRARSL